ncbi:hypothetical protein [Pseudorhodoplanes sp.]|uniref:hypothetical protein n=1 Tax=Pseudorhodoplanes sp. TaxID=1934341 RepID=UPI002CF5B1D3|nr:hypothetical protein [Pseudorhodoplanes sp.]HWV51729.1 hypothetical protein [Pseudorhodoplanes sp.]
MQKTEEFADRRLKSWCIHCARSLADLEKSEDHVPSKSLLLKPRPHHLPVVTVCRQCNTGFSLDEQYTATFLSCVLAGSTELEKQTNGSAARALTESPGLRALIDRFKTEFRTSGGETRVLCKPDTERIERVILKNARGHAYFEFGEPMLESPASVFVYPLVGMTPTERRELEGESEIDLAPWPDVGSRMMTRLLTGEDMAGPWVIVQEGIYRYAVLEDGGVRVRCVLSEYLAVEVHWER